MRIVLVALISLFFLFSLTSRVYAAPTTWEAKATLLASWKTLVDSYPGNASYEVIGRTELGADIWAFSVGNGSSHVVMDGTIHGMEYFTAHSLYFVAEWLLTNGTAESEACLNNLTVVFVPHLNWDLAGPPYVAPPAGRKNSNGVDLNRNFVTGWGLAGSSDPASEYYRGPSAASESETQTIRALVNDVDAVAWFNWHDFGGYELNNGSLFYTNNVASQHTANCEAFLDEYEAVSSARGVSEFYTFSASKGGYARDDGYSLSGGVAFCVEEWYGTPEFGNSTGLIKERGVCLLLAAESLYGAPASEDVPIPGADELDAWVGPLVALAILTCIIGMLREAS